MNVHGYLGDNSRNNVCGWHDMAHTKIRCWEEYVAVIGVTNGDEWLVGGVYWRDMNREASQKSSRVYGDPFAQPFIAVAK